MDRERCSAGISLVTFSLVSIVLLLLPLSPLVGTVRGLAGAVFYPFLRPADALVHNSVQIPQNARMLLDAVDENRALRRRNLELQAALGQYEALLETARRYDEMTGSAGQLRWSGVWARVISAVPPDNYSSVIINRGAKDGVRIKDPVLAVYRGAVGLAGKVIETSSGTARVMLVSDPMSSVTCSIRDRGTDALLEGLNGKYLRLNYIPPDSNIAVGDTIVTSAVSVLFPAGVTVGRVVELYPREAFMTFLSARIEPAVNIGGIGEVFVLAGGQK
ncbi:MAG: rod shape-determining protein MreC [Elusimicrobiaceae bacterium]|nr:rod shape-determining protein MreC [Elusimicrobiaceae bacterium]